jgi:hypothetical protein
VEKHGSHDFGSLAPEPEVKTADKGDREPGHQSDR